MLDARLFLAKTWPLWPSFEGATVGDEEQRRYPRAVPPKRLKVAWQSGTRRAVSYLESIGLGGLFILTRQAVPLRSMVKILMDLQFVELRARAVVPIISPPPGLGIKFIPPPRQHRPQ